MTEVDTNLKNWMLAGAIFLANAAMFLVATATFHNRTPGRRGPAAEGVMLLLTTITVSTALTGVLIVLVAAAVHETRQRAAAAATSDTSAEVADPGPSGPARPDGRGRDVRR